MGRLKVLFITSGFPTKEIPVVGTFVREQAKAVQLYNDVTVIHMVGQDQGLKGLWRMSQEVDKNLAAGIPTYRIWYRHVSVPRVTYFIYIWSIFQMFRRIVALGFRPDIIHAHFYDVAVPAVIIGKLYRIPVLVTEHSSNFPRKRLHRYDIWGTKFAFKFADLVMPVSKSLQRSIQEYGVKARFHVVPNIVDTRLFYPNSNPEHRGHVKRLLVVCLFDSSDKAESKGLPYLFNALAMLHFHRKDWHLDMVGDGPSLKDYEHMVKDLGISEKVTFHGLKPKRDVADFMRRADILVLPSLFETFSVIAAEALVTGTPVLAARCGGPEEFITEEVGLIVEPADGKALCDGLNFMLEHLESFSPDYISKYAVSLFSPEQVGEQLRVIYSGYKKA